YCVIYNLNQGRPECYLAFLAEPECQDATRVQGFFQHLQVRFGDGPWQDVKGLDEVGSDTGRTGE
uniref:phage tail fiber C-terminal domain-containing protein n=1 Tax=Escherichia coli TaxID=562 RepID=UPI00207562DC